MIHPRLRRHLEPIARRRGAARWWLGLAGCWGLGALVGVGLLVANRTTGMLPSGVLLWCLGPALAGVAVLAVWRRRARVGIDRVAREIEARHPELEGRLLTALEQQPDANGRFGYLQERLLRETLAHNQLVKWRRLFPESRMGYVKVAHALALIGLVIVCFRLSEARPGPTAGSLAKGGSGVEVTPGDTSLERGSSLVVMARFNERVPANARLVISDSEGAEQEVSMVKSLADPVFGGSVPEVTTALRYHVAFDGGRTPDFDVQVFDYPRLDQADVTLNYPDYTGKEPAFIPNTRRASAVEGTRLDLALQLNKSVTEARLLPKDANAEPLVLEVGRERPTASLSGFSLRSSGTYELELVDADGRSNKVPAVFTFVALENRRPELKIASPRGDTQPSALEEVQFSGTVWDDFGVLSYGLTCARVGADPLTLRLGRDVSADEKRSFATRLELEELEVEPNDFVSWFLWAEDIGPDGEVRTTTSDQFFAEVRPFEQVFREGQSGGGQGQDGGEGGGGAGGATERLIDLQKQIMNATWNLKRRELTKPPAAVPGRNDESRAVPPSANGPGFSHAKYRSPVPPSSAIPHSSGLSTRTSTKDDASSRRVDASIARALQVASGPRVFAQTAPGRRDSDAVPPRPAAGRNPLPVIEGQTDLEVVIEAAEQALAQAQGMKARAQDQRTAALWDDAVERMSQALEELKRAKDSPGALEEALSAQRAASQALLRLQASEFSVSQQNSRNAQGGQNSRSEQMRQQLQELEFTQSENRYETQSQARAPQSEERREDLQVMSRLQELARRQQDLNERLQELQTTLQEARTEAEREAARRELKRLREEEQRLMADLDELQQRMNQPQNQSRMAEQRQQLEQTRQEMQRAAQAAAQGEASQALASGTRAQRQMQELRDQMRQSNASEFAEDMRQMRAEARDLTRRQEQIQNQMDELNQPRRRALSESDQRRDLMRNLAQQQEQLTNLVNRMTDLSQQAEEAEPLMSRTLYESLRGFSQEDRDTVPEFRQDLLERGLLTRSLYERMKAIEAEGEAQALALTSELLEEDFLDVADEAEERARAGVERIAGGVERAAEQILGDDSEALRLARDELESLSQQLEREIAQGEAAQTNSGTRAAQANTDPSGPREQAAAESQVGSGEASPPGQGEQGAEQAAAAGQRGEGAAIAGGGGRIPGRPATQDNRGTPRAEGQAATSTALDLERLLGGNEGRGGGGPITGTDFAPWSDRLRDVEDLVEEPGMRNSLAQARERARQFRQDYRRAEERPDWAVVRLEVYGPLVEVTRAITEELARRNPDDSLVPLDRDPVPTRYSELVRRYYEALGKDQ